MNWATVDKDGPISPQLGTACWMDMQAPNGAGYGRHRASYEENVGKIPTGYDIDHLCDVRLCVRWDGHLEPVTRSENNRRAVARGRMGGGRRKLASADVRRILDLIAEGMTDSAIGTIYSVVPGNIWAIRKGLRTP